MPSSNSMIANSAAKPERPDSARQSRQSLRRYRRYALRRGRSCRPECQNGEERWRRRPGRRCLHPSRLRIEPTNSGELLCRSEPRLDDRALHHRDRPVEHLQRHRIRMAVLAAVRDGEASGIGEAIGRAVHDFRDLRERSDRPSSHTGRFQQLDKVFRSAVCGGGVLGRSTRAGRG